MKKTMLALIIFAASVSSCKKEKNTDTSKGSTVYLQAEAVDFDNVTTTLSPVATVSVIEP